MKTKVSIHEIWAVFLIVLGTGAAQAEILPAKELVQYVLNSRRLGVKESQMKKDAVAGGWPPSAVDEAIVYTKRPKARQVALPANAPTGPVSSSDVPSRGLLQYVVASKLLGVTEAQIRQTAVGGGWPVTTVDEAIVYARTPNAQQTAGQAVESIVPASFKPPVPTPETSPPQTPKPSAPVVAAAPPPARQPPPAGESTVPASSKTTPGVDAPTSRGVPDDYQIGAGDVLQVFVWKQPDVTLPSVVVRPDGRITVPLIKDVEVGGSTPRQAEKAIAEQLAQFIVGVDVTVVVTAINSKKVYILGGVKKEGPIPYTYRMTVLQALSEAGGLTDYAKRKKIYVLRTEKGKDYLLAFNYDEVTKGEKMEQNIQLLPGDQLVVPR